MKPVAVVMITVKQLSIFEKDGLHTLYQINNRLMSKFLDVSRRGNYLSMCEMTIDFYMILRLAKIPLVKSKLYNFYYCLFFLILPSITAVDRYVGCHSKPFYWLNRLQEPRSYLPKLFRHVPIQKPASDPRKNAICSQGIP